ncbi:hypothetical protein C492_08530 [Natronococcus jeotgali DSM 18795]|uniref:TM2 domain-containing protein n=1 Tax=Natronococcus jeotgali DSM 18795 TaxID=1227498 RepID=L9XL09_9EURY|nr:hypothetical protein C492_08530 [Natronococcus jeotgali DSM 18795]
MEFPRPDLRENAKFTVTVLLTLAFLQYTGIFYENAGTINWRFLLILGMILPIFTCFLTIITANIEQLPDYDRVTRTRK